MCQAPTIPQVLFKHTHTHTHTHGVVLHDCVILLVSFGFRKYMIGGEMFYCISFIRGNVKQSKKPGYPSNIILGILGSIAFFEKQLFSKT